MMVVKQPFVLDFGGAWLDVAPEFSENAWNQWQRQLDEVFEERATELRRVLAVLRSYAAGREEDHRWS